MLKKFSEFKREVQLEAKKIYLKEESHMVGKGIRCEITWVENPGG